MRVLLVNKFYDPRGGTERVLFDLEDGLRERGHEVAVFATRDARNRPSPWSEWFALGRDYEATGLSQRLGHAVGTVYDRRAREAFARLLDHFDPEVVHFHNIYHQLSPSLLDEVSDRRLASVLTLHDYKLLCPVYRLFRDGDICTKCVGTRWPLWSGVHTCSRGSHTESWLLALESTVHRLRKSYERGVGRFVSPSRFLADRMLEGGAAAEQLTVIPNAPRHRPSAVSPDDRDAAPTILYAGRLSEEKGVDLLVEAARRVPSIALRIAGDGPLRDELCASATGLSNVHWLGHLGADELARERGRAWAVAVPSRWWENAPLSVLEAFAAARPVLVADHGGLVEMVEEGETGWRLAPSDPEAWTAGFERVAGSAAELATLGERARRVLDRDHSYEDFLRAHEALYSELVVASSSFPG